MHLGTFTRSQQLPEELIPQLPRSRLHSGALIRSLLRHIAATKMKLQPMLASQPGDKLPIRLRLRPAQPMIEMNDRKNDAEFLPQLDQQPQQRDGINPARNGDPDPVPSQQQFLAPDVDQDALC
jgi:hypothetical protein